MIKISGIKTEENKSGYIESRAVSYAIVRELGVDAFCTLNPDACEKFDGRRWRCNYCVAEEHIKFADVSDSDTHRRITISGVEGEGNRRGVANAIVSSLGTFGVCTHDPAVTATINCAHAVGGDTCRKCAIANYIKFVDVSESDTKGEVAT